MAGQSPFDVLQFLDDATDSDGGRILRGEPATNVGIEHDADSDAIRLGHGDGIDHERERAMRNLDRGEQFAQQTRRITGSAAVRRVSSVPDDDRMFAERECSLHDLGGRQAIHRFEFVADAPAGRAQLIDGLFPTRLAAVRRQHDRPAELRSVEPGHDHRHVRGQHVLFGFQLFQPFVNWSRRAGERVVIFGGREHRQLAPNRLRSDATFQNLPQAAHRSFAGLPRVQMRRGVVAAEQVRIR